MIITKRTLFLFAALILLVALALAAPGLYDKALRTLHGVKAGVTLEGQLVEGLLKQELYDVVASLAESSYVEASNASCNWQTGEITPEVVGWMSRTVDALLAAPGTSVELVTVLVLPSITSAHFEPIYRGPTSEPRVALMVNVDWGDEYIPGMLDVFRHYGVSATWFPTGRWIQTSRDLARTISLEGHEIGNHGGWHDEAAK